MGFNRSGVELGVSVVLYSCCVLVFNAGVRVLCWRIVLLGTGTEVAFLSVVVVVEGVEAGVVVVVFIVGIRPVGSQLKPKN